MTPELTGPTELTSSAEDCSILLADDDRNLCATLKDVLETEKHAVDIVTLGREALASCRRHAYDVLLLDISLPDLSGLELISQLEEIQPRMDILIITGHASLDNAVQAVSRSTIGYLVKPLDLDRLLAILDGIARRKQVALENQHLLEGREALIQELEEKNAELERYTYTVSHDLTSPLVTITGFLGMIEKSAIEGDVEQVRTDISRIMGTTHRMKQLLDELLELSRIGRVVHPPRDVALSSLVQEAIEGVLRPEDRETFEIRVSENLPTVRGDRIRLRQVFQNLVDNAVKFIGDQPQPRIEIGLRRDEEGRERIFFVRDNGIGISEEKREKVFGLFDKLDKSSRGSGIGLALVKRIVKIHGGRIWVESAGLGKGSCFCLTLPGAKAEAQSEERVQQETHDHT